MNTGWPNKNSTILFPVAVPGIYKAGLGHAGFGQALPDKQLNKFRLNTNPPSVNNNSACSLWACYLYSTIQRMTENGKIYLCQSKIRNSKPIFLLGGAIYACIFKISKKTLFDCIKDIISQMYTKFHASWPRGCQTICNYTGYYCFYLATLKQAETG